MQSKIVFGRLVTPESWEISGNHIFIFLMQLLRVIAEIRDVDSFLASEQVFEQRKQETAFGCAVFDNASLQMS